MTHHKRIILLKIDLPAILAIFFFAGLIFFYLIPGFEKVMMDRKRNLIHEITSSAYSLLEYYHLLEIKGELDNGEAKEQAKEAISLIRYGEELKDYFWITDMHPRMIVHPYRPDLNGSDLSEFQDSKGKKIFVEFVRAVTPTGESFVDYMWQWNDDSTRIVPKLSYVRLFEPWGWIIGTGIYVEDVKSEIARMELRALVISGIIGSVIIILLIVISLQSHKIEQKRNRAEDDLQKSRELYRTLAEAASEGVLIWSRIGLQANKILLSWLDYTEEELRKIPFREIFISPEITESEDPDSLYEELYARRYVESVIRSSKGKLIKSHADFSRILMGEIRAIIVTIRPVSSIAEQSGNLSRTDLLNEIGIGFFKITYGRKNRFIYASEPMVKMLGYDNLTDLIPHDIESFFFDPLQYKSFRSALMLRESIIGKEILLRQKGGNVFWALVNVMVFESESREIWCEGTIEPLAAYQSEDNTTTADLDSFGASFILEGPVTSIMSPIVTCKENLSVADAVLKMERKGTHFIVVTDDDNNPLGVADAEAIGIRLAKGDSPESEIFRWMDSPPDNISIDARIDEAFRMVGKEMKKNLIVINKENRVTGIISSIELSRSFFKAPGIIFSEIAEADSPAALRSAFLDCRKISVAMILGHADPYSVSLYISSVADAICRRILEICLEESGKPPCRFAFIQTGSAGRHEQTLSTDQDNAIIFENCEGEKLQIANRFFLSLGKKVNDLLQFVGYRLCKGGNMAGNPKWCQPLRNWKKYFSDWIKVPGPDELLEVSIFFDFRFCFGDTLLSDELREYINKDLKTSDIFFHHMAAGWERFSPSLHNISEGETDIKKILMPLTGIIRLYSLKHVINGFSSIERIIELYSGKHLDVTLLRETIKAWKDLTTLRLIHQASCVSNGTEPDNIIDLHIVSGDLVYFAERSVITVKSLLLKAGSDFYTVTI